MKVVSTFTATIYVGLREKYSDLIRNIPRPLIQEYVDSRGLCVTITATEFIYTDGSEPGFMVGLINYPRFPSSPERIRELALDLGEQLRIACGQQRVSIVMPDETVMLDAEQLR